MSIKVKWQARQERKKAELRLKNARLRAQGKEPLKGWGKMVDTGFGGLNAGGMKSNGTVDLTGDNLGTENYFTDEQKKIAEANDKKHQ